MSRLGRFTAAVLIAATLVAPASTAEASHSWGTYHWARTANPFTLKLGDNVSAAWDGYLVTTSADWTTSSVLDTTIVAGSTKPRLCRASAGKVEVCNATYGSNGWLGIASIWASGSHITQATVKLNDTYFNTARYNTPAWKNFVMCQEVGHVFGLDHQDEDFDNPNLGSCMDYTNNPDSNQHPNQHDYDQLEAIYAHFDSTTTVATSANSSGLPNEGGNTPRAWGRLVSGTQRGGTVAVYVRRDGDEALFTFVVWA